MKRPYLLILMALTALLSTELFAQYLYCGKKGLPCIYVLEGKGRKDLLSKGINPSGLLGPELEDKKITSMSITLFVSSKAMMFVNLSFEGSDTITKLEFASQKEVIYDSDMKRVFFELNDPQNSMEFPLLVNGTILRRDKSIASFLIAQEGSNTNFASNAVFALSDQNESAKGSLD